jgi:RhoGEF domain
MIKQRKIYRKIVKRARYRKSVVNELIQTEKQYVYSLFALIEFVRRPAMEFLDKEVVAEMFSNIPEMYQLN